MSLSSHPKPTIGIIGTGISGIMAAYLLQQRYHVILFETADRLGGHTHTVEVDDPQGPISVDTGFIVFNTHNYPLFTRFLDQLNVPSQDANMSFGYYDPARPFWYSSDFPSGIFSQKRHLLSPSFYRFLSEINRFNHTILAALDAHEIDNCPLSECLARYGFSDRFLTQYLIPMSAAIWSCPADTILTYPAKAFFTFWQNHRLLTIGKRPQWRTVKGGSHHYIKQFKAQFTGTIHCNCGIQTLRRHADGIDAIDCHNHVHRLDKVVIATHADEALAILDTPSPAEQSTLSPWQYSTNQITLHRDSSVMPPRRSAWAAWLVKQSQPNTLTMTYYMNRLQRLSTPVNYFTSLNLHDAISESSIIKQITYTHPIYTVNSLKTQAHLPNLNGNRHTYFCGSYFGSGFHEDGVRSAVMLANQLGCTL